MTTTTAARTSTDRVSLHREQAAELAMLTGTLHRWLVGASGATRAELAAFLGGAADGALAVAGLVDLLDLATVRLRRRLPEQVSR
jgi:hypothetical protein